MESATTHNIHTATVAVGSISVGQAFYAAVVEGDYGQATAWANIAMVHTGVDQSIHYSDSAVKRYGTFAFA